MSGDRAPEAAPRTVPALLAAAARQYPGDEALVDGEVRLTWGELAREVRRAARAVIALGIRPGDPVAVWAPNGHRWIVAALSAVCAGAVLVPVNTRYKGEEAAWLLRRSGARLLFVDHGFLGADHLGMLDEAAGPEGLPALANVVTLGDRSGAGARVRGWEEHLATADRTPDAEAAAREAAVGEEDVSDMLFTSGTTGRPKGAMTTHVQNVRCYEAWSERAALRHGDRYLLINPLFHSFGYKAGVLACLRRGATMVLQPVFDVPGTLRLLEDERITVLPGPPTVYTSLLDHPDRPHHDLSALRLAVTGAAVVPVALVRRMREELCPQVLTAYGLTEACGMVSMCTADDAPETVATTAGRAIDGVEITIAGPGGRPAAPGVTGEILVSGYNVMAGYHQDPEATAEAVDDRGRLRTGDVGHLDADGNLTITDRLKDMYVSGGFNVYPAEIEQLLARHPDIAEAAVVGVPDARMGERGRACVILRPGARLTEEDVLAHCRERMANFKVPREVKLVESLPRNASGKVVKAGLRNA